MLLIQGLIFGLIYYVSFKFLIIKLNIATPGREDGVSLEIDNNGGMTASLNSEDKFTIMATKIYEGLGESSNIVSVDNCITRLRIEVKDKNKIDKNKIKEAKVPGVRMTGPNNVQIIVGTQVQFVADELQKIRKEN